MKNMKLTTVLLIIVIVFVGFFGTRAYTRGERRDVDVSVTFTPAHTVIDELTFSAAISEPAADFDDWRSAAQVDYNEGQFQLRQASEAILPQDYIRLPALLTRDYPELLRGLPDGEVSAYHETTDGIWAYGFIGEPYKPKTLRLNYVDKATGEVERQSIEMGPEDNELDGFIMHSFFDESGQLHLFSHIMDRSEEMKHLIIDPQQGTVERSTMTADEGKVLALYGDGAGDEVVLEEYTVDYVAEANQETSTYYRYNWQTDTKEKIYFDETMHQGIEVIYERGQLYMVAQDYETETLRIYEVTADNETVLRIEESMPEMMETTEALMWSEPGFHWLVQDGQLWLIPIQWQSDQPTEMKRYDLATFEQTETVTAQVQASTPTVLDVRHISLPSEF